MRLQALLYKDNRIIRSCEYTNTSDISRTKKVLTALDKLCYDLDLAVPMWLDKNIKDFQRFDKVRFNQDNFVEELNFDYMEFRVIEE